MTSHTNTEVPSFTPFEVAYFTPEYLEAHSPSRKDGVSVEQEQRWIRSCIHLIINSSNRLKSDVLATLTAIELLQRYYAQRSLLRSDRFLMSAACIYLAGKVVDKPKSVRDVLMGCCERLTNNRQEVVSHFQNRDWLEAAKDKVFLAERMLLYTLGFRFNCSTANVEVVKMVQREPIMSFSAAISVKNPNIKTRINNVSYQMAIQSAKTKLCLSYDPQAIAAACIWLGLKLLRIDTSSLERVNKGKQWYTVYVKDPKYLEIITDEILASVFGDVAMVKQLMGEAVDVKVYIERLKAPAPAKQHQKRKPEEQSVGEALNAHGNPKDIEEGEVKRVKTIKQEEEAGMSPVVKMNASLMAPARPPSAPEDGEIQPSQPSQPTPAGGVAFKQEKVVVIKEEEGVKNGGKEGQAPVDIEEYDELFTLVDDAP